MKNKEELIISDTNIFIDLFNTNLLKEFFNLPYKIKTSVLVFSELKEDKQLLAIKPFIDSQKLQVDNLSKNSFNTCYTMKLITPGDLSIADCSVWLMAKTENGKLITNDKNLRKAATKDNVDVRGLFYIFDEMLKNKLITFEKAIEVTDFLIKNNNRFPLKIAETKMEEWNNKKSKKTIKEIERIR